MPEKTLFQNIYDRLMSSMRDEADQMVALEKKSVAEIIARHLIIATLVIIGSIFFQLWFPIIWLVIYISTTLVSRFFLSRLALKHTLKLYLGTLAGFFARLIAFRTMMLYLWFFPHLAGHYIGLIMLIASVRFSVNLKSRIRSYMYLHTFTDLAAISVIAVSFLAPREPFVGHLLVAFTVVLLMVYYGVTFIQNFASLKEIEILEAERRQALKMEAVGRLTGGVAHDFNNILTVVMGNLELYNVTTDPDEKRELLGQTHDAARRAADLTSQLLAFSRQSRLTQDVHSVHQIFTNVEKLSERLIPSNIKLHRRIMPHIHDIRADGTQLEVALLNLIINARDAMPDGGKLELVARNHTIAEPFDQALPGTYVRIDIIDEGTGISQELIDKVVEPFFTTKPVGKGSGLGLSMVKGYAEQSGGFLKIVSSPGNGTTVCICLPAVQTGQDPESS